MKPQGLPEQLRYSLAGALLLVAVAAERPPQLAAAMSADAGVVAAGLVGLAFVLGALIYTVHRALIYQLINGFFLLPYTKKFKGKCDWDVVGRCLGMPDFVLKLDEDRWRRRRRHLSFQRDLAEWAAQVHFLYCAAWALIAGRFIGIAMASTYQTQHDPFDWSRLAFYGLLLIGVAAVVHHRRYMLYEMRIAQDELDLVPKEPTQRLQPAGLPVMAAGGAASPLASAAPGCHPRLTRVR